LTIHYAEWHDCPMKTAYSFIRWSTKRQSRESSDSNRRQTKSAQDWCQDNGYTLSNQVFIGAGESGYKASHLKVKDGIAIGALARFIEAVEQKKIIPNSVLCVDSVDRWSRQEILDALEPFTKLLNLGIGIVFTGSPLKKLISREAIKKDPSIINWLINEMIRSHAESEEKSRKVREAKQAKKEIILAGHVVPHNNVPKYFHYVPITRQNGKYEHNENTKIVLELIQGILNGKSLYQLTCDLNKRGVKTFRYGYTWHPCSVRQILKNRCLIGEYLGIKNYVKPIIDEDQFNRIQNILAKNRLNRGKKAELVNIFKGLCECGYCEHQMQVTGGIKNGVSYRYLRCSNYHAEKTECNNNFIRLAPMEEDFFLKFLGKNPAKLLHVDDKTQVAAIQKQINAKTHLLNITTAEIKKLITVSEGLDVAELKDRIKDLQAERDGIKISLDELTRQINNIQDTPKDIEEIRDWFERMAAKHAAKKDWFMRITDFDKGETKELKILSNEYLAMFLKNNEWREGVRVKLPSLIGKIVIKDHKFFIYNSVGRLVSESSAYESLRNNSERWKKSLKTWGKRKQSKSGTTAKEKVDEYLAKLPPKP